MKIAKTTTVKLTGKEYTLLQNAGDLVDDIVAGLDGDDFKDCDLRGARDTIYAFLDDPNVYVEWE
jgi:hypothetical protein